MSGLVNITTLAEANGLPRDKAKRILEAAGVTRDKNRLYTETAATEALQRAVDPARAIGHHATGMGASTSHARQNDYADAKTLSERERFRKLALENDLKSGKLVSVDEVTKSSIEFATYVRTNLLGLPPKVGARLVGKSAEEIISYLDRAIRETLTDLSDVNNYALGAP